jgi:tetratricopeptide (TPR) repeat protein
MTAELLGYKEVAELFDLPEARLRYWAQTGICGPSVRQRGKFLYTFPDLVGVKVAKELTSTGLPLQKVRRNLDALRLQLPQIDRPLSQLRVCSDGNELFVLDEHRVLQPASGQVVMSFAIRALDQRLADVRPLRSIAPEQTPEAVPVAVEDLPSSPYSAFLAGLEAEEAGELGRAEVLLRHAVKLDPHLAAAWTNLGNLRLVAEARGEAKEAYERALALDPEQPEARYNLANLLFGLGKTELALAEYRRVIASEPAFADAHYNLGVCLLELDATAQARTHLQRYVDLAPDSEHADHARRWLSAPRG